MTPADAFIAAAKLHNVGRMHVSVNMAHASNRRGVEYIGDDDRRAGRTATVSVNIEHGLDLGELTALRHEIRELGYDAAFDGASLEIIGRWDPA